MSAPSPSSTNTVPQLQTEGEGAATYTLEILVQLSGVTPDALAQYQQEGLVAPIGDPSLDGPSFDDDALRTLRRIEHLRMAYGMTLPGIRLMLKLLDETERLHLELRALR